MKDLQKKILDPTGAELAPGEPDKCEGNGKDPRFEICCDECDYYQLCFPEWNVQTGSKWKDISEHK